MRRTLILCHLLGGNLAIAMLLATSSAGWAQGANSVDGIRANSADATLNIGWSDLPAKLDPSDTNSHVNLGFSSGINLTRNLALVGEYSYQRMSPLQGVAFNTQFFGSAARLSFGGNKVVPYVLVGGGGARLTGSEAGVSLSSNGGYFATGGGVNVFLGKNWGIRPELRYDYLHLTFAGLTQNTNVAQVATGLFFQFGGKSPNKQIADARLR